jgi:hypothetical protein
MKRKVWLLIGSVMTMRDFRLQPRSREGLPCSALLNRKWWYFLTDVSGQGISLIFKDQEVQ